MTLIPLLAGATVRGAFVEAFLSFGVQIQESISLVTGVASSVGLMLRPVPRRSPSTMTKFEFQIFYPLPHRGLRFPDDLVLGTSLER